jgi:hypothetical protein
MGVSRNGSVAFLASPAARWITGVSLAVDGGRSLRKHPELLDPPGSDAGWGQRPLYAERWTATLMT